MADNAPCADNFVTETLADVRNKVLRRLGMADMAGLVSIGTQALIDDFIRDAQQILYRRHDFLRLRRLFSWTLVATQRFYDLNANNEQTIAPICTKRLDPVRIESAWFQDNSRYVPLDRGIDLSLLNFALFGPPQRYDVAQSLEIWPEPPAGITGKVWLRGRFLPAALAAGTDTLSIDAQAVFLLAVANAKAHFTQPDAGNYVAQLEVYLGQLSASSHGDQRYVPGQRREIREARPVALGVT